MLSALGTILALLKALPQGIALVTKLVEIVQGWIDAYNLAQAKKAFEEAVKKAKETKDTSDLENRFGPPK